MGEPTPRTDDETFPGTLIGPLGNYIGEFVAAGLPRQLEQELAKATAEAARLRKALDLCLYFLVENFPDEADADCEHDDPSYCRAECQEGGCVIMRIKACRAVTPVRAG